MIDFKKRSDKKRQDIERVKGNGKINTLKQDLSLKKDCETSFRQSFYQTVFICLVFYFLFFTVFVFYFLFFVFYFFTFSVDF
jgi:hypothetical protein